MPTSFIAHPRSEAKKRNLKKVPFVELFGGKLQGVVSSGSSGDRVYVSFVAAGTGNFYCATNNNRPCGGLRGGGCKHLDSLLKNAVAQYGNERVASYLGVEGAVSGMHSLASLGGSLEKTQAGEVFARFLAYLRYVEMPSGTRPLPDMAWFAT